jgi:N-acetylmuramoyl-L-alanine amidase
MLFDIVDDRLVVRGAMAVDGGPQRVAYVPTKHVGGRIEPTLIVLHDTAGGPPGDSVAWLASNPAQVSAHCIVKPDGSIVQLAPFDRRTNHAGESSWMGRKGCNGFSIGIEIVNPGLLRGTPDRATSTFGKTYSGAVACGATQWHKAGLWLPYTEAQLEGVEELVFALALAYPSIAEVVGHHHVSPGRKIDPTPLMPWPRMRAALGEAAAGRPTMAMDDDAEIRAAQARLAELLYAPGDPDGLMGPRTRGAVRTFQEQNRLPVTGALDEATAAALHAPEAKEMPTGTRDAATAADLAAAGSGTVAATNKGEAAAVAGNALTWGNVLADAAGALTEAEKAVAVAEGGRGLGTRIADLAQWAMTPRGFTLIATAILTTVVWLALRRIRARRVAAHKAGRQV